jgi:hypothetical protein
MLALLLTSAFADELPPAHYHPDKIAAKSEIFAEFSRSLSPRFDTLQADLSRWSQPVEDLERAVLLMGDRAPEALQDYAEEQRRTLVHQYLTAQAHVTTVEDDSAATFGDAMGAALDQFVSDYALYECGESMSLVNLAGPGGRAKARCEGESLNEAIAAALDGDAALRAAVDEMIGLEWPQVALTPAEQAAVPLTGGDGYIQLAQLAEALDGQTLSSMAANLEDKLSPVESRIAAGDEAALTEAEAIRERYELAMAARGDQLLEAVARVLEKDRALVGICANPEALGGCAGEDRTRELVPELVGHKKIVKALK